MTSTEQNAPATFAEAQVVLAATLPGYTRRPQQEGLAEAIETLLASGGTIMAQAGCGTGKSLAALIPAIQLAVSQNTRVIVATATKALQRQYVTTDIPFLQEHLGIDFRATLLKGRANYACAAKLDRNTSPEAAQIRGILEEDQAHSGDRDDLPRVSDEAWRTMSATATECPGAKECPFGPQCKSEAAKNQALGAHVVITNLAYLIQDLKILQATEGAVSLLGNYSYVVIDEAHNLPDVVTSALSDTITQGSLSRVCSDADQLLTAWQAGGDSAGVATATQILWEGLQMAFDQWVRANRPRGSEPVPFRPGAIAPALHTALTEQMEGLAEQLADLRTSVERAGRDIPREDKDSRSKARRLIRRLADWQVRIQDYCSTPATELVTWIEQDETPFRGKPQKRLQLRSAPVDIAPFMRANFWDKLTCVLMSATLSSGIRSDGSPDFGYLQEAVGLDSPVTFDAGSPFDYTTQARLYVPPATAPVPAGATLQAWRSFSQEAMAHLVTQAGGGALLLFTSTSAMNSAYDALAPRLRAAGLTVLRQGDMPPGPLKDAFQADEDSVLFGLKTFMEGVDVQGRSCRLVVLDKLPFTPPTDLLYQARCERVNERYGPRSDFSKLAIPMMTLVLDQAFGRLIRHRDDRGVVAILDPRLVTKSYGARILRGLPPAPRTTDIQEAAAFFGA